MNAGGEILGDGFKLAGLHSQDGVHDGYGHGASAGATPTFCATVQGWIGSAKQIRAWLRHRRDRRNGFYWTGKHLHPIFHGPHTSQVGASLPPVFETHGDSTSAAHTSGASSLDLFSHPRRPNGVDNRLARARLNNLARDTDLNCRKRQSIPL